MINVAYEIMSNLVSKGNNLKLNLSGYSILNNMKFADINSADDDIKNSSQIFIDNVVEINLKSCNFTAGDVTIGGDTQFSSGYYNFGTIDDSNKIIYKSLQKIDLSNTSWIQSSFYTEFNTYTGDHTFANCSFPLLSSINFTGALFGEDSSTTLPNVYTANYLFYNSDFPLLTSLVFDNTYFAIGEMTEESVFTASHTFDSCNFGILDNIDLSKTILYAAGLTAGKGDVYSAYYMFANATFNNIKKLDLGEAYLLTQGWNEKCTSSWRYISKLYF